MASQLAILTGVESMVMVRCPACDKNLNVPDKYAGKKAKCPSCQETLTIPEASVEVTPVAPSPGKARNPVLPPPLPDEDEGEPARVTQRPSMRPREEEPQRPRGGRAPDYDDDDDRPRRRRPRGEWADCPKCGAADATRVHWTFWGGFIGPMIINTVRCNDCGTSYNGVKGDYNTVRILIYVLVPIVIGVGIAIVAAIVEINS